MTTPVFPDMPAGAMIVFPAEVVHCATPYVGKNPRITFAWNINRTPVAGTADDEARGIPKRRIETLHIDLLWIYMRKEK